MFPSELERYEDIISLLCVKAPSLLSTLFDGLIWRSKNATGHFLKFMLDLVQTNKQQERATHVCVCVLWRLYTYNLGLTCIRMCVLKLLFEYTLSHAQTRKSIYMYTYMHACMYLWAHACICQSLYNAICMSVTCTYLSSWHMYVQLHAYLSLASLVYYMLYDVVYYGGFM